MSIPRKNLNQDQAIIISGGQPIESSRSVEVLTSYGSPWCHLQQLPENRSTHTQSGLVTCGGGYTRYSCLSFSSGQWSQSHNLLHARWSHISWSSPNGLLLMGGYTSDTSSEMLTDDGNSLENFSLKYKTKYYHLLHHNVQINFVLAMHVAFNWMKNLL